MQPFALSLYTAITAESLTANLQLCLDAADRDSYPGGQSFLDRSGNGYDFFLGADGSATSTDPTWLGTWFESDGGDHFTYDSTNETWMENLHKNNAAFTALFFIYYTSDFYPLSDTGGLDDATDIGVEFRVNSTGDLILFVAKGTSGYVLSLQTDGAVVVGGWNMVAVSLNEATGAGGGFFYRNGAYAQVAGADTFTSTYASPSASNATRTMVLGKSYGAGITIPAAARLSACAFWSSALTKANLDGIFTRMRGRFLI